MLRELFETNWSGIVPQPHLLVSSIKVSFEKVI